MSGVPCTWPGTCYSCNVLVRSAANGLQCSYSAGQHFLFPLPSKLGETLHILHMTWMVTVNTLFKTMKMHNILSLISLGDQPIYPNSLKTRRGAEFLEHQCCFGDKSSVMILTRAEHKEYGESYLQTDGLLNSLVLLRPNDWNHGGAGATSAC